MGIHPAKEAITSCMAKEIPAPAKTTSPNVKPPNLSLKVIPIKMIIKK